MPRASRWVMVMRVSFRESLVIANSQKKNGPGGDFCGLEYGRISHLENKQPHPRAKPWGGAWRGGFSPTNIALPRGEAEVVNGRIISGCKAARRGNRELGYA